MGINRGLQHVACEPDADGNFFASFPDRPASARAPFDGDAPRDARATGDGDATPDTHCRSDAHCPGGADTPGIADDRVPHHIGDRFPREHEP